MTKTFVFLLACTLLAVFLIRRRDSTSTPTLMPVSNVILGESEVSVGIFRDVRDVPSTFAIDMSGIPVLDQGGWGSCAGFALRYAYLNWLKRTNATAVEPSVAFWYALGRQLISSANAQLTDTGTTLTSVFNAYASRGAPPASLWPYTAQNIFIKPPLNLSGPTSTIPLRIPTYSSVASQVSALQTAISSGKCIVCAIRIYSNTMNTAVYVSGNFPMPAGTAIGGHAICLIGYNQTSFTFINSWGTYYGLNGVFTIPKNYVGNSGYAGEWYAF